MKKIKAILKLLGPGLITPGTITVKYVFLPAHSDIDLTQTGQIIFAIFIIS